MRKHKKPPNRSEVAAIRVRVAHTWRLGAYVGKIRVIYQLGSVRSSEDSSESEELIALSINMGTCGSDPGF